MEQEGLLKILYSCKTTGKHQYDVIHRRQMMLPNEPAKTDLVSLGRGKYQCC